MTGAKLFRRKRPLDTPISQYALLTHRHCYTCLRVQWDLRPSDSILGDGYGPYSLGSVRIRALVRLKLFSSNKS